MSDHTTAIADLLASSRRSHVLYHQFLPRMAAVPGSVPQLQPGEPSVAQQHLKDAAAARAQAQRIDPNHESPAWADEAAQFPHDDLMLFYLTELAK